MIISNNICYWKANLKKVFDNVCAKGTIKAIQYPILVNRIYLDPDYNFKLQLYEDIKIISNYLYGENETDCWK